MSKYTSFTIRMPSDVHQKLQRLADAEDRSLNYYVVRLIRQDSERPEAVALLEHPVEPKVPYQHVDFALQRGVVHHIDGDPTNNDLSNIVVLPE